MNSAQISGTVTNLRGVTGLMTCEQTGAVCHCFDAKIGKIEEALKSGQTEKAEKLLSSLIKDITPIFIRQDLSLAPIQTIKQEFVTLVKEIKQAEKEAVSSEAIRPPVPQKESEMKVVMPSKETKLPTKELETVAAKPTEKGTVKEAKAESKEVKVETLPRETLDIKKEWGVRQSIEVLAQKHSEAKPTVRETMTQKVEEFIAKLKDVTAKAETPQPATASVKETKESPRVQVESMQLKVVLKETKKEGVETKSVETNKDSKESTPVVVVSKGIILPEERVKEMPKRADVEVKAILQEKTERLDLPKVQIKVETKEVLSKEIESKSIQKEVKGLASEVTREAKREAPLEPRRLEVRVAEFREKAVEVKTQSQDAPMARTEKVERKETKATVVSPKPQEIQEKTPLSVRERSQAERVKEEAGQQKQVSVKESTERTMPKETKQLAEVSVLKQDPVRLEVARPRIVARDREDVVIGKETVLVAAKEVQKGKGENQSILSTTVIKEVGVQKEVVVMHQRESVMLTPVMSIERVQETKQVIAEVVSKKQVETKAEKAKEKAEPIPVKESMRNATTEVKTESKEARPLSGVTTHVLEIKERPKADSISRLVIAERVSVKEPEKESMGPQIRHIASVKSEEIQMQRSVRSEPSQRVETKAIEKGSLKPEATGQSERVNATLINVRPVTILPSMFQAFVPLMLMTAVVSSQSIRADFSSTIGGAGTLKELASELRLSLLKLLSAFKEDQKQLILEKLEKLSKKELDALVLKLEQKEIKSKEELLLALGFGIDEVEDLKKKRIKKKKEEDVEEQVKKEAYYEGLIERFEQMGESGLKALAEYRKRTKVPGY